MRNTRTLLAAVIATGALSLGGAGAASAATQQDGLVVRYPGLAERVAKLSSFPRI